MSQNEHQAGNNHEIKLNENASVETQEQAKSTEHTKTHNISNSSTIYTLIR